MSYKYPNYKKINNEATFQEQLLPLGYKNRSGEHQCPKYIVIHEVSTRLGRSPESFDMEHYRDKIFKDGETSQIGYHFLVSDKQIYQFIPEDEVAKHSGTVEGNHMSIGIERLICEGVNYNDALHNQAKLIATLMVKWNIPFKNVVTHKQMQTIFKPAFPSYNLACNEVDDINLISSTKLFELYKLKLTESLELCKNTIEKLNPDDEKSLKELNDCCLNLDKMTVNVTSFDKFSKQRQIVELHSLLKTHCQIRKKFLAVTKSDFTPFKIEIDGLKFEERIQPTTCPSRLVAGQYGGVDQIKREVLKCVKNNWFYTELLSDELCNQLGVDKVNAEKNNKKR